MAMSSLLLVISFFQMLTMQNKLLNVNHSGFFKSKSKEILFYGGAGAGKSYSVADKILLQPYAHHGRKIKTLVVRKTFPSLRRTCMNLIEQRAGQLNIPYKLNKAEFVARSDFGSEIHYVSMNHTADYEKVKSITDLDTIWIEEANEITENAYDTLRLRMRGGEGLFKQVILTFNPVGTTSWIYDRWFVRGQNAEKIVTNVYDNKFINKEYVETLEDLKNINMNLYRVYCLGEWGQLEGIIWDNFIIVNDIDKKVDETIYGLDFGFNNPTALIKISICDNIPYIEQCVYESKLTNQDLIKKIKSLDINKNDIIYCDSAEPDRIQELKNEGYNARSSEKSVIDGIDFVKNLELRILEGSEDIIKEIKSYTWEEDKNGHKIDKPVKFMDHTMDAIRYALYTHLGKRINVPLPKLNQINEKRKSRAVSLPS